MRTALILPGTKIWEESVRPRGFRAGLTALLVTAGLTATSACGIIGNPLGGKGTGPSAAASASAPSSPSPVPVELAAGQCFGDYYTEQIARTVMHVIDCTDEHYGETVYVGRFVGDSASGAVPILDKDASAAAAKIQNDAYQNCSTHADQYLGHSWIHRLVSLRIVLPTSWEWAAGDRWYRCDLYETSEEAYDVPVERTGSLKTIWFGALCVDENKTDEPIVDCKTKHPGEFVGGFMLPAGLKKAPVTKKEYQPYYDKCWKIMATYLGVTTSRARYLVGVWVHYTYDFEYWASGRRAVWCYTWTGEKASSYVTGSAKGRKGKGL
jgi:Septum formation